MRAWSLSLPSHFSVLEWRSYLTAGPPGQTAASSAQRNSVPVYAVSFNISASSFLCSCGRWCDSTVTGQGVCPVLPSLSTGVGDFALYFVSLEHRYCAANKELSCIYSYKTRGLIVLWKVNPSLEGWDGSSHHLCFWTSSRPLVSLKIHARIYPPLHEIMTFNSPGCWWRCPSETCKPHVNILTEQWHKIRTRNAPLRCGMSFTAALTHSHPEWYLISDSSHFHVTERKAQENKLH